MVTSQQTILTVEDLLLKIKVMLSLLRIRSSNLRMNCQNCKIVRQENLKWQLKESNYTLKGNLQ